MVKADEAFGEEADEAPQIVEEIVEAGPDD
jgi:hypothetical protein